MLGVGVGVVNVGAWPRVRTEIWDESADPGGGGTRERRG